MENKIRDLLVAYEVAGKDNKDVGNELATLLAQLPISSYDNLVLEGQNYRVEFRWHNKDDVKELWEFSVLCPHGYYFDVCEECQNEPEPEVSAEEILGLIIRDLTKMVESLQATVTARNQLARGLRATLANKQ